MYVSVLVKWNSLGALYDEIQLYYGRKPCPLVNICYSDVDHQELHSLLPLPPTFRVLKTENIPNQPIKVKYKSDLVQCISMVNPLLSSQTKHILIFEDDVIVMKHFFWTLYSLINLHRDQLKKPWLDVKLYKVVNATY